jgi:DNA-binding MarR family transcriptional regulator
MKMQEAIKQKQFINEYLKADINLYYTASRLLHDKNRLLKPFEISIQQFNILRILRGLQGRPASLRYISERMIDQMSNASRLVEKLRSKGMVERISCPNDRRQVEVSITQAGLDTIEHASKALEKSVEHLWESLKPTEAETINQLLDKLNVKIF